MRGNPWPHDMVLGVESRPHQLLELLWIREAHHLERLGDDLPPVLAQTPAPAAHKIDDVTRVAWESAWTRIWSQALAHVGRDDDPSLLHRLADPALSADAHQSLMQSLIGPDWGGEFGRDVFDDPSWTEWNRRHVEEVLVSVSRPLRDSPERRVLDVLIPAWRAGLTKVVTVPCSGQYTRKLSSNALLVTDSIRSDDDSYRAALCSFV